MGILFPGMWGKCFISRKDSDLWNIGLFRMEISHAGSLLLKDSVLVTRPPYVETYQMVKEQQPLGKAKIFYPGTTFVCVVFGDLFVPGIVEFTLSQTEPEKKKIKTIPKIIERHHYFFQGYLGFSTDPLVPGKYEIEILLPTEKIRKTTFEIPDKDYLIFSQYLLQKNPAIIRTAFNKTDKIGCSIGISEDKLALFYKEEILKDVREEEGKERIEEKEKIEREGEEVG
eukprot:CAMPEP_0201502552 /NCGR_PEP_ID=MMETSP0151_2-20130828/84195_1 /ASSEMBLY_ACC=CAM_ASM_000257 /TAXON_ID=200890 /ORGANISM="Paramoeba atlantica, Strain 621/1 / CCAP 1560/9" /LENGTH=227 /DNA_ID=CAMNT_0047896153 /DNA_START=970 /DNA_END=1649 /DNA_ORIENTATION=-